MTLQSAIDAELPFLRAEAEAMMTLTVVAHVPTGGFTTDAAGYQVPAYSTRTPHRAKAQDGSQAGSDGATRYVNIGGVERPVLTGGLHISIGAPVPVASEQRGQGWEYVVTAVGAVDDPALLGRRFLVVGVPIKSYATARRLDVVEV